MASCDFVCIGEYVFLLLWFISVPTYCMVIYTIVRHRKTKFKEEFWLLAISLFVSDMLHLCQYMWSQKMASWGYLPSILMRKRALFGWLMLAPQPAFLCAEFMGVVFLSINRYLAIMKPLRYKAIWTRKKTICCVVAQWTVAGFVLLRLVNIRYTLFPNPYNNGTTYAAGIDPGDQKAVGVFFGIIVGIGGCVQIALYVFLYGRMLYHVYKENRKTRASQQRSSLNKAEFNLAIMGGLLALVDMAITLHAFDLAIRMQRAGSVKIEAATIRFLSFRAACFTDVYGWMNAWLLLACCQEVRNQFSKQFGCKKAQQTRKPRQTGTQTSKRKTAASSRL